MQYFVVPCKSLGLLPSADHTKIFGQLPTLHALNSELLIQLLSGTDLADDYTGSQNISTLISSVQQNIGQCSSASQDGTDACENANIKYSLDHLAKHSEFECSPAEAIPNAKCESGEHNIKCYLNIEVGEAFLKIGPFLKTYATYAANYQQALNLIEVGLTAEEIIFLDVIHSIIFLMLLIFLC